MLSAVSGDYYFLIIYIVRNKICVYIKILATIMTANETTNWLFSLPSYVQRRLCASGMLY
jgi:hypothetical protein